MPLAPNPQRSLLAEQALEEAPPLVREVGGAESLTVREHDTRP